MDKSILSKGLFGPDHSYEGNGTMLEVVLRYKKNKTLLLMDMC